MRLEQLDAAGDEWYGEHASAVATGTLREVLAAVCPEPTRSGVTPCCARWRATGRRAPGGSGSS